MNFMKRERLVHALQSTYEDAYEASLQCIILETSDQKDAAYMSWTATLNMINNKISKLPGTPRSGNELSLMNSILDIQRQCKERLSYLQTKTHQSPAQNMTIQANDGSNLMTSSPQPAERDRAPALRNSWPHRSSLNPSHSENRPSPETLTSDYSPASNIYFTPPTDLMNHSQSDNNTYSSSHRPLSIYEDSYSTHDVDSTQDDPFGIYLGTGAQYQTASAAAAAGPVEFGNFMSNTESRSQYGTAAPQTNSFMASEDDLNDHMYRLHPFDSTSETYKKPPPPPPPSMPAAAPIPPPHASIFDGGPRPPSRSPPPVPRKEPLISTTTPLTSFEDHTSSYFDVTASELTPQPSLESSRPTSNSQSSLRLGKPPVPVPIVQPKSVERSPENSSKSSLETARLSSASPDKFKRSSMEVKSSSTPFSFLHRPRTSKSMSVTDLNFGNSPVTSNSLPNYTSINSSNSVSPQPPGAPTTPPPKQTILRTLRDGKGGKLANGSRGTTANMAASKAWAVPDRSQNQAEYANRVKMGAAALAIRHNMANQQQQQQHLQVHTNRQTTPPLVDPVSKTPSPTPLSSANSSSSVKVIQQPKARPQQQQNVYRQPKTAGVYQQQQQQQHSQVHTNRQTTPPLVDPVSKTPSPTPLSSTNSSSPAKINQQLKGRPQQQQNVYRKPKPVVVYRSVPVQPRSSAGVTRMSTVKATALSKGRPVITRTIPAKKSTASPVSQSSTPVSRARIVHTKPPPTSEAAKGQVPVATSEVAKVQVPIPILATGAKEDPVSTEDQGENDELCEEELTEMQKWEKKTKEIVSKIRGIDENAANQIMNDIILKGDEVRWDDIAGLEQAKTSLKETVVYPFLRPDLFSGLREPARGMLLFGPPGTGKTMLARAVATESKSTFFSISAASLVSKFLGESEKLVRALFLMAQALAPSIIFVDEIDSLLSTRSENGEHETSRRIKTEFLVQWSDLQHAAAGKEREDSQRVLVLAATNLPWAIDEAARRRFVRRQYIPLPENETRRAHLKKLLSYQVHTVTEDQFDELVKLTEGFSGSDLTALAKDAAMGPLRALGEALLTTPRDQIRPLGFEDFESSLKTIRPSVSKEGLHEFEKWADMYGSSGA